MNAQTLRFVFGAALLALLASASPSLAQNRLVNMVPQARSGETNQDAEPTLAINPSNYSQMAGSAFTWDNLTQGPMVTNTAPIYVSSDRGATWTLALIVPSIIGSGYPTGDINLSFGSTLSGALAHETSWLYTGILRSTSSGRPMTVLRTQDYLTPSVMTVLDTRTGNVDQPHVASLSDFGGSDKLYVGFNNGYGCTAPNGRSATLDVSQSAAVAAPTFALDLIQARNTACQDGFAEVPAVHLDGTVYAAFIGDWNGSPRMVVVRDDAWGASATPFTALTDPSDSLPGRFLTTPLTLQSGQMGQNRLGASNVSIAIDPRTSDRVYVAYGDRNGPNSETIHVRRSTDRGQSWSADLVSVTDAMNPQVAINSFGTVGLLYQAVVANRWEARLVQTTDPDATVFNSPGLLLANTDATTPLATYSPYIGDYASLRAAGKNFFGIFSASNFPDTANFLPGATFQRYVDWAAHILYADAAHTTQVPPSIDPYFFEVSTISPDQDFYVRDWTNDATHGDNGVEPSTNPVFYATSDVWNRRSTSPGAFINDQPDNRDAGNGTGPLGADIGDNWAFVRVRRNAGGAATPVTAHFLVSKFGTGSNYVDSSSGDPDVTFPDPDPVIATGPGTGPWISTAYHWHLNAIAGNHLCLAVEISTPGSPYIPPSLLGQTPGWPTTDLRIVNDNHKAQRNMHLSTLPPSPGGSVTDYAIVHNGSLFLRDIPLRIGVSGPSKRYLRSATMRVLGREQGRETAGLGKTLVLRGMQPGENRWVAITLETTGAPQRAPTFLTVDEMNGTIALNGFGVGTRTEPIESAIRGSLEIYRGVAERLAKGFQGNGAATDMDLKLELRSADYIKFVHERLVPHLKSDLGHIRALAVDPLDLNISLAACSAENSASQLIAKVATLLNGVDARLTMLQLEKGDVADIMQMVRWQKQLFERHPKLSRLPCAAKVAAASAEFLRSRESGKLTNSAYPKLLEEVGPCLREAGGIRGDFKDSNLATLQKEHRDSLLALTK